MVRLLYTLPNRIKNKSIYIWNVDKDSITEFTKLAIRQIDIKGFVTEEEIYIGEQYMNRPVVGIETALKEEDIVIILSEKCDRNKIPEKINQKAYFISELLQIDEELKRKKVYIYGAGIGGKRILTELKAGNIDVEAFCVTHRNNENIVENKNVYQIDEIVQENSNAFIVSVLRDDDKQDMIDVLDRYGADIYIRDFLNDYTIFVIALFQSIHKAWHEKKKIYVYTKKLGGYLTFIEKTLEVYGIRVSGYVYKEASAELGIRDIYELVYEEIQDIYVLVNDLDIIERKEQIAVYDLLESIGFSISEFNYAGFHQVTTTDWRAHIQMIPDPLVGWSLSYGEKDLPGIHVFGNMNKDDVRIVVLGGSTSTEGVLRPASWVKQLHQKLISKNLSVTIFDCAGPDEDAFQELLRFIRDGVHLKPQCVISMSGVNNAIHRIRNVENKANLNHMVQWYNTLAPDAPYVCGIPIRESAFTYWIRMQKIIKSVVEQSGGRYYCFLQPIKETKEKLTIFEKSVHFSGDAYNEAASFRIESRQDDFYINLLSLFDEQEGMFIDNCHYSEKANELLAEIVYEKLLKDLFS